MTTETTTTTSSSSDSKQLQRAAFNWQFLNTNTEEPRQTNVRDWGVGEVVEWLKSYDLGGLADTFAKEDIDGRALLALTDQDFRDLGLSLGNRKKVEMARSSVLARLAQGHKKNGVILAKGFSPVAPSLSDSQRRLFRLQRYNASAKVYEYRDRPLTDAELECWDEQAAWLVCPISGKKWLDEDSILGVGLYHAPRLMSDKEIQRALDDELRATAEKQSKREKEAEERKKTGKDAEDFAKDFQVYPSVYSPPVENLDVTKTPDFHKPLDIVTVIVGPTFDARAFNWGRNGNPARGIQSKKERGVLSMDQQYNAFNFLYYVLRAQGSYERKICTNRLSFFIDEFHGARVFPENIESQLSLLVYRDKRLCKSSTATRAEEKERLGQLGDAIRNVIPRVLRAVIMEVANGRSSALEERIDYSIRTYLLIHQISIKLVLYYRQAYESLYRSIVLWIQNPFAELCEFNWPNLEDVLIGASLVGIPWAIMRESFVKKLMHVAVSSAPNVKSSVALLMENLFEHNKQLFHLILYEFSFLFTSNRSLVQIDDMYSRCAGTLPRAEREVMKERLKTVEKVSTFMEVWATLGMDVSDDDDEQMDRISKYLKYISANVDTWKTQPLPESKIRIPDPSQEIHASEMTRQGIVLRSDLDRQKEQALALERAKHRGFPPLNRRGGLDRNVCLYPLCNKKFKCRDHLFKHLRKVIEPERMITRYHADHLNMTVNDSDQSLECHACHEVFTTREEINAHYSARGVRGTYRRFNIDEPTPAPSKLAALIEASDNNNKNNNNNAAKGKGKAPQREQEKPKAKEEEKEERDPDAVEMGTCVICMDKKREAVNMPCGHLICCYDCSLLVKECAMCRVPIRDVIRVFCS